MEPTLEGVIELKANIAELRQKIQDLKNKKITDPFQMEMIIMEELPEIYSKYPWMTKKLTKGEEDGYLDKFVDGIESVIKGEKTLASVELKLGMELKEKYVDPVLKNKN